MEERVGCTICHLSETLTGIYPLRYFDRGLDFVPQSRNSYFRCARSIFSERMMAFYEDFELPDPLPFRKIRNLRPARRKTTSAKTRLASSSCCSRFPAGSVPRKLPSSRGNRSTSRIHRSLYRSLPRTSYRCWLFPGRHSICRKIGGFELSGNTCAQSANSGGRSMIIN
jgi:hypothetical protein